MAEYAGPLVIYLLFYIRPSIIYGSASSKPIHLAAQLVKPLFSSFGLYLIADLVWVQPVGHFTTLNVS